MKEVPCRHTIEMTKFNMKDTPEEPDIEALEEREYTRLLDHEIEMIVSAIGPDGFSIKEYREEWDKHIQDIADAIYDEDELELGKLIMARAVKHLRQCAEDNVRESA